MHKTFRHVLSHSDLRPSHSLHNRFCIFNCACTFQAIPDIPGVTVMRMLRCFRVFRLFKRVPSLRKLIGAISASVRPVTNAFSIVCLVTSIYAIIFVTFFAQYSPDLFESFFISLFTLFQVAPSSCAFAVSFAVVAAGIRVCFNDTDVPNIRP